VLKVGVTGGLACGKSTVAAMLAEKGCGLINADGLGHQAITPGEPAYEAVLAEFGRDLLDAQGRVDRARLAARVFSNPERVQRLNQLVHPHILQRIEQEARAFARLHPDGILVIEAALLLEAFAEARVDRVVVVDCSEQQQVERFRAKGGTAEEARQRMAAQMSRAERLRRAHYVVDTTGTLEETRRQVEDLFEKLSAEAARSGPQTPL